MNHTHLLNHLAAKYNLKSYLEIGVQNPANNFNKINCRVKVGTDPEIEAVFRPGKVCMKKTEEAEVGDLLNYYEINKKTSDHFFATEPRPRRGFSLVFIDGYHSADQVERDFNNSMQCLNDGGFIVIHDTLPEDEITTCVPRGSQKIWFGDVYKWGMEVKYTYDGIDFVTLNTDCGCMLVWKDSAKKKKEYERVALIHANTHWADYIHNRERDMNVIEPSELDKYLPKVKDELVKSK